MLPTTILSLLLASSAMAHPSMAKKRDDGSLWSRWSAPKEGDVRSPCPCLNSLANHGLLSEDGSGTSISKQNLIDALDKVSVDEDVASGLYNAVLLNGLTAEDGSFDLDSLSKHNVIEHDGSLSRADAVTGDDHSFNQDIFDTYLAQFNSSKVDAGAAGMAREFRIEAAKASDPEFTYGPKQQFTSLAETAAFLAVLGGPSDPQVPVEWLKTFFEQERFPYTEGWRPSTDRIGTFDFMALTLKVAVDSGTVLKDVGNMNLAGLINAFQSVPQLHWPKLSIFGNRN